jgi:hypothetical protein
MTCRLPTPLLLTAFTFLVFTSTAPAAQNWWKGNTHTHSLWSDGNDFPEMITDWYVKHGYHFLAISDHNVLQAKEVWMSEAAIAKRQLALGKTAMQKYRERFGDKWVETRQREGAAEVRLKKLEEYRTLFEKPDQFLLVQAEELSASFLIPPKQKVPIHMNGINLQEEIKPVDGTSIADVLRKNLRAIREQGTRLGIPVLGHINHPNFQWALTAEDMAEALEENFFEIYNGHPKINYEGDETRAGYEKLWDIANTLRITKLKSPPLFGLGTDDAHHYHGGESLPGRGWVMVHAPELKAESLIESMRNGDFYASSGVTLDEVSFAGTTLKIRIHAEQGATYTTRIVGTPKGFDPATREVTSPAGDPNQVRRVYSEDVGKTFATIEGTDINYALTGEELYVRAVITCSLPHTNPSYDGQKQMAWTQPVGWKTPATAK